MPTDVSPAAEPGIVTVRFIGGFMHGNAREYPVTNIPENIMNYIPQTAPVWGEGFDPIKIDAVDVKVERYTRRRVAGINKDYYFFSPDTWSDDDIMEFLFC